ncbi:CU044_2847 family protein [Kutzneria buriramensis]|uniref:Trypsin-co-occurring domain-containing protein n=1 Tax=Kutzneria buriramensis TaxID=1045776 RepID=A0A3E0GZZ2_9PSEU|nr:CU044_2847 family protein [Kutzneria buriramensis]REH35737.1 hypothetical protein BCF44_117125 [Kutzneria buriramensis]
MTYLVELPVGEANGQPQTIAVEIEQAEDGLVQVSRPGEVVARAGRSLGEMLAGVRPVAEHFVQGFRDMATAPDEIGIEFGLSLSAKADVIISSTAAQANFKVTLKWHKQPADEPAPSREEPTASAVEEPTE